MTSKMDELFKRVLNDKDIFYMKRQIFNDREWNNLKEIYHNPEDVTNRIHTKIENLKNEKNNLSNDNKRKKELDECIKLCEGLLDTLRKTPNIAYQLFTLLQSFGLVGCNLPNMDDYGKVIERYGITTVEQFFLDKIRCESNRYKKRALKKVLEYIKELYNCNLSSEEIAYFVRKLDSLKTFWEVLNE